MSCATCQFKYTKCMNENSKYYGKTVDNDFNCENNEHWFNRILVEEKYNINRNLRRKNDEMRIF